MLAFRTLLIAALAAGVPAASCQTKDLPASERVFVASKIYAALQMYFAHWQGLPPDFNLDSEFQSYAAAAVKAPDRAAFDFATMEFLARFRNGHTLLLDRELMDREGQPVGFAAEWLNGKWVVTESQRPGLQPGDVIQAIDSKPFESFFQAKRRYISSSTEQWVRNALFVRLANVAPWAFLFPKQFTLTLASGQTVVVNRGQPAIPTAWETSGRWLVENRTAYIRIPSFSEPKFEAEALDFVKQFRGADSIIIDLRHNTGGSTPGKLIAALMDKPYRDWIESTPQTTALFKYYAARGDDSYEPFDRPQLSWANPVRLTNNPIFHGKLALLVDGACNSACEDFTFPFKESGRAVVIGENTAGSSGQPFMLDFPNGMMVLVGAKRLTFPGGMQFEGVGIRPDVEVQPAVQDLAAHRDTVLQKALETVSRTAPSSPPR